MEKMKLNSVDVRTKYLSERDDILMTLRSSTEGIDLNRLNEYKETILKAYQGASLTQKIADVRKEHFIENYRFKSIGLYHRIKKSEFNAENYVWGPYFSDVGRAVALGEKKYFFSRLANYVKGCKETISRRKPNFEVINMKIREMLDNNIVPNTIIYPVQISVDFIKYFNSNIDWSSDNGRILNVEDCKLRMVWSNKYAKLRSFIILDSRAGIWYVRPDAEEDKEIAIAIGESKTHIDCIEYLVETLAYYKINNTNAFIRINLSK